uniref:SAUR family protein n=1 Tax=Kalanchoe fedtschenkoi TaxID=63787 RepID=A0A7N1A010_KALFE
MGVSEKLHHHHHHHHLYSLSFIHHRRHERRSEIPKGCVAVLVGQGEEQERVVVPVMYVNHPLFAQLLKEAEEEYGFDQKGPISIPCHVEEFRSVRGLIDKDTSLLHHHHHHHASWCFGA